LRKSFNTKNTHQENKCQRDFYYYLHFIDNTVSLLKEFLSLKRTCRENKMAKSHSGTPELVSHG
jgi:hypothetical protein